MPNDIGSEIDCKDCRFTLQRFCGVGEVRGFDALENWFWVRRRSNKIGSPIDS